VDPSSIRQLAALARLDLTEAEAADAMARISRVLGYCASLARVPTEGVAPSPCPMALHDRFRADEPQPSLDPETALANAPDVVEGCYRVPRVVEG
jgi:aspartyl-tRNA(Asn)/glutamyl-tRNA(Gln) amidotransferase subunit C